MGGVPALKTQFLDTTRWYHRPLPILQEDRVCGAHILSYLHQMLSDQDDYVVTHNQILQIRKYVVYVLVTKNDGLKNIFRDVDTWVRSMEEEEEDDDDEAEAADNGSVIRK
jgi:hypothetical protein